MREATREVHERLHRHPGFAAVTSGDIDRQRYVRLLSRLHGFHRGLEHRLDRNATQSTVLGLDLEALGMRPEAIARLPRCTAMPAMDTRAGRLGALYVIEGAALGGRVLARALDRLLGAASIDGRRFFTGQGTLTGAKWQAFIVDLERCGKDETDFAVAVAAAQDMFAAFEVWLDGWELNGDE